MASPNIGSIKLRTNLKHKVCVTNVALIIRYITSFENKQQKAQKQENHKKSRCQKDLNVDFSYFDMMISIEKPGTKIKKINAHLNFDLKWVNVTLLLIFF